MKKIILLLTLVIAAAAAWFVFLRPSDISQDVMTADYEAHKEAFAVIASYLVENQVSVRIEDIISADKGSSVPNVNDEAYRNFNEAVEEVMGTPYHTIVSDGKEVTFVYNDNGGRLNHLYASVIYNGLSDVEGKITVKLGEKGWHLYIALPGQEG